MTDLLDDKIRERFRSRGVEPSDDQVAWVRSQVAKESGVSNFVDVAQGAFARGLAGTLETGTALRNKAFSALGIEPYPTLSDDMTSGLQQVANSPENQPAPGTEGTFPVDLAQGLGSVGSNLVTSVPLALAGVPPMAGAALSGFAQQAGPSYYRALRSGQDETMAWLAFLSHGAVGASEGLGAVTPGMGRLAQWLVSANRLTGRGLLPAMLVSGGREAAQEFGQGVADELLDKYLMEYPQAQRELSQILQDVAVHQAAPAAVIGLLFGAAERGAQRLAGGQQGQPGMPAAQEAPGSMQVEPELGVAGAAQVAPAVQPEATTLPAAPMPPEGAAASMLGQLGVEGQEVVPPPAMQEMAGFMAKRGVRARFVDAGQPLSMPAMYEAGEAAFDVRAEPEMLAKQIATHELYHHIEQRAQSNATQIREMIAKLDPGGLQELEQAYAKRRREAGQPVAHADLASEGTATYVGEVLGPLIWRNVTEPARMAKIAEENRPLFRRIVEAVLDFLNRFGGKFSTREQQARALLDEVGVINRRMPAAKAVQLGKRVADLLNGTYHEFAGHLGERQAEAGELAMPLPPEAEQQLQLFPEGMSAEENLRAEQDAMEAGFDSHAAMLREQQAIRQAEEGPESEGVDLTPAPATATVSDSGAIEEPQASPAATAVEEPIPTPTQIAAQTQAAADDPELAKLRERVAKAQAALDALGETPPKPSSEKRRFGPKGREGASPEAVAAYDKEAKTYRRYRRLYSVWHGEYVSASNELMRREREANGGGQFATTPDRVAQNMAKFARSEEDAKRLLPANAFDALKANDWLGFDSPQEAIRAVMDHPDWSRRWEIDHPSQSNAIEQWRASEIQRGDDDGGRAMFATTPGKFATAPETASEALRRRAVDDITLLGRVVRNFFEAGGKLRDAQDPFLARRLIKGLAQREDERQVERFYEPIKDKLREAGKKTKDVFDKFGQYLYARHAPERNAQIAKINPTLPSGSGMSNAEAAKIQAEVAASDYAQEFEEAARLHDQMQRVRLQRMVKGHLLTLEEASLIYGSYTHYTPLRDDLVEDWQEAMYGQRGTGQGISITGQEIKRALGRGSMAANPLAWSILQDRVTTLRIEKNRANRALRQFVQKLKDPTFARIVPEGQWQKLGLVPDPANPGQKKVGLVGDPDFANRPNVVAGKQAGERFGIEFGDEFVRLSMALKQSDPDSGNVIVRNVGPLTRFYADLATRHNPAFPPLNLVKDSLAALPKAWSEQGPAVMASMMAKVASGRSWKSLITRDAMAERYANAGGPISAMGVNEFRVVKDQIQAEVERGRIGNALNFLWKLVGRANDVAENTWRFAYWQTLVERGMGDKRAALAAKELTSNFEVRGELGPMFNALWAFSNAGIQGTRSFAAATKKPAFWALAPLLIGGAAVLDQINRTNAGTDDNGENEYDKIDRRIKETNIILMNPATEEKGDYITIPLPPGPWAWMFSAGADLGAAVNGPQSPLEAAGNTASNFANSLSPLGDLMFDEEGYRAAWLQAVTPTLLDLPVQVAINQRYSGVPIHPEQMPFQPPVAESKLAFKNTSPSAKDLAQWLSEITQTDDSGKGAIEIHPNTIEYVLQQLGSGLGRTATQAYELVEKSVDPESEVGLRDFPVLSRFYREPSPYFSREKYFDNKREVEEHLARYEELRKEDPKAAREYREAHKDWINAKYRLRVAERLRGLAGDDDERALEVMATFNREIRRRTE